ncbi:MAG: cell division protein FtsZ [Schleiferiaceae bacterium]|nr:cell division protein FtsZ [Schleiferiaceae bacterium]
MPKHRSSVIKVIGVGGGGSNAVNYMKSQGIRGVDFIICNTDVQALEYSSVENKVQLGVNLTEGLGAGANPKVGEKAAIESYSSIQSILGTTTKMVFITAGMGGGTGTGAAPIIAKAAREMGVLTIGIVTVPFHFEGGLRLRQAETGIEKLKEHVDSLIVINNNKLREVYGNLGFKTGFNKADEVLATAAKGIAEVITHHYNVNIDLRDAKTVLKDSGTAIMGSSKASGSQRAIKSVQGALDSPLLNDNHIQGARHVLLLIVSGNREHEITFDEIGEINDYIQSQAGKQVDIIMGIGEDEQLNDAIQVTIVATGFNASNPVGTIKPAEQELIVHELDSISEKSDTDDSQININITKNEDTSAQFDLFGSPQGKRINDELNTDQVDNIDPAEDPLESEPSQINDDEQIIYQLEDEESKIKIRFDNEEDKLNNDTIEEIPEENNILNAEDPISNVNNYDLMEIDMNISTAVNEEAFEEPLTQNENSPRVFDAFSMDAPVNELIPETSPESKEENIEFELEKSIEEPFETITTSHPKINKIADDPKSSIINDDHSKFLDKNETDENLKNQSNIEAKDTEAEEKVIQQFSLDDLRALENELLEPNEKSQGFIETTSKDELTKSEIADSPMEQLDYDIDSNTTSIREKAEKEQDLDSPFTLRNEENINQESLTPINPDQDSIDDSMQRLANQRRAYLQNFNHQFGKNVKLVAMAEEELQKPSFERNGVDLPEGNAPHSQENKKSNLGLSGEDDDIEFLTHNSFLHDNVD